VVSFSSLGFKDNKSNFYHQVGSRDKLADAVAKMLFYKLSQF
jgi:hypothetical protein